MAPASRARVRIMPFCGAASAASRSWISACSKAAAAAANTPLRSFPEEPDMLVKNGRYGAYIAYKGKNYRLPKGSKPEELTLDDCLKIVADSKK